MILLELLALRVISASVLSRLSTSRNQCSILLGYSELDSLHLLLLEDLLLSEEGLVELRLLCVLALGKAPQGSKFLLLGSS